MGGVSSPNSASTCRHGLSRLQACGLVPAGAVTPAARREFLKEQEAAAILTGMRRALIGFLVVLAAAGVSSCGDSSAKQQAEKREAERRERATQVEQRQRAFVAELASPHHAVIVPPNRQSFTWTADVQDALMPDDGRPIAGVASLTDIEREGKAHVVSLAYGRLLDPLVILMLKCGRPTEGSKGRLFTGERILVGPRYAFVAKIDVVRPIRGVASDESGPDLHRVGWLAEGRCLALQKMPLEEKADPSDGGSVNPAPKQTYGGKVKDLLTGGAFRGRKADERNPDGSLR